MPIENSTNGYVPATLDLLCAVGASADAAGDADAHAHAQLCIVAETHVAVQHCLLGWPAAATTKGTTSGAAPTLDLTHIKHLHSHPQAWTQCSAFLSTHLAHTARHDAASTSAAAALVAASLPSSTETHSMHAHAHAALSSAAAASLHAVPILAANIADRADNATRFLLLRRRDDALALSTHHGPLAAGPNDDDDDGINDPTTYRTLLLVRSCAQPPTPSHTHTHTHEPPPLLPRILAALSGCNVSIAHLNARPSNSGSGSAWQYDYLIEASTQRLADDDGATAALRATDGVRDVLRLGSWRRRRAAEGTAGAAA